MGIDRDENQTIAACERGSGVGSRLVTLAEKQAVTAGAGEVRLYTNDLVTKILEYYPRHWISRNPSRNGG